MKSMPFNNDTKNKKTGLLSCSTKPSAVQKSGSIITPFESLEAVFGTNKNSRMRLDCKAVGLSP